MGITVNINSKGLEAKLDKAKGQVNKTMMDELNTFSRGTVAQAKTLVPVDEGFLRNSISFEPATMAKLKTTVVVACNYGAFVEFGTRRFAAAYVSSLPPNWKAYAASFKGKTGGSMDDFIQRIMAWVLRKGISGTMTKSGNVSTSASSLGSMQQAAYFIALNILQNGVRPHPYLFPSVRDNERKLKERLKV